MNVRPASAHEMNVRLIQSRGFFAKQPGAYFYAGFAQISKAATGNLWIRIFNGRDNPFDSRLEQRIGARLRAPVVRMRFQRNIGGTTARSGASLFQRDRLGMLQLIVKVKAFSDDLSAGADDDGTNERARTDLARAPRSQIERAGHHLAICFS